MSAHTPPYPRSTPGDRTIDFKMAARIGSSLTPNGIDLNQATVYGESLADDIVQAVQGAAQPVQEITQMGLLPGANIPADIPARVVDRPEWIATNSRMFQAAIGPTIDERMGRNPGAPVSDSWVPDALQNLFREGGRKAMAVELGTMFAFLAPHVLGQCVVMPDQQPELIFVAPNMVAAEKDLQVDSADFRLWVALHEYTHLVQFTAVPWLAQHVLTSTAKMVEASTPGQGSPPEKLANWRQKWARVTAPGSQGLGELFTTPVGQENMNALVGMMSLLEGHAEVVMDAVGPEVIPTVSTMRAAFQKRRESSSAIMRLLRQILGVEGKMEQYRDGARFVRAISQEIGMEGFNHIWTSAHTLPTREEISAPDAWLKRVNP